MMTKQLAATLTALCLLAAPLASFAETADLSKADSSTTSTKHKCGEKCKCGCEDGKTCKCHH